MNSHGIFDSYPAPTPSMLTSIYYFANKLHSSSKYTLGTYKKKKTTNNKKIILNDGNILATQYAITKRSEI